MAKLADTPPMVGSVSTEMKGSRLCDSCVSAAEVLAICISENRPSCMRAPPLAEKQTKAEFDSIAASTPCTKRSPTTDPIEPPMNLNSNAAATTGSALTLPPMTTSASDSDVFV